MPTAKGLLRVTGTLDLTQFWPDGESDADTVKVVIKKIEFSPDRIAHLPFKVVKVFDKALVKGAQGPPKPPIKNGKLTVRLQGVDATELHFSATLPKKGLKDNGTKYRQHFGESGPIKLHDFLSKTIKKIIIPCEVVTFVDHPNDVFDTYARMIGDVLVTANGTQININHWLTENGWALPTYYNSMLETEIQTIESLAKKARSGKKGIWKQLSKNIAVPDTSLIYRSPGKKPKPAPDAGPAVMPKLFRRQIRYFVSHENELFPGTVSDYLSKQKDPWVKTTDFLKNTSIKPTSKTGNLGVLVKSGKFTLDPDEIVFFEAASTLVNSAGKKITSWS